MNISPTAILLIVACLLLLVVIAGVKPAESGTSFCGLTINLPDKGECVYKRVYGYEVRVCK